MLDVLIRGGEVLDGSGTTRHRADVGIRDGRIVSVVGQTDEPARRTIDARDRVVAPGFVDVHTHFDAQAFWDPALTPAPQHGITTVFGGNCGFTIAPLEPSEAGYLMRMLARVEGIPLAALESGVPWDWRTTEEYLARLDDRLAINTGFMVGHSAVRRAVMGGAANERHAMPSEIDAMEAILRSGLRAGAIGFSSTWSTTHNDAFGAPVPSRHAAPDELIALAGVCREVSGTSIEFLPRTPSPHPHDEVDRRLMIAMSTAARRPLNWNLVRVTTGEPGELDGLLRAGTEARDAGARVVALHMPELFEFRYSFSHGIGFDSIPGWERPMALSREDKARFLADSANRQLLSRSLADDPKRHFDWGSALICETFSPNTVSFRGRRVAQIALEQNKDPFDALLDIAVADGTRTCFSWPTGDEPRSVWRARAELCRDPRTLLGGSDAGAHLDVMTSSSYGTNAIANFTRVHEVMALEEIVHLLTAAPARFYGLHDRGLLAAGFAADVVVFDETTIGSTPWETRFDLPGGAARLYSEGTGIDHVFVNGVEIVDHGGLTGALPGRILRSGVDTTGGGQRI